MLNHVASYSLGHPISSASSLSGPSSSTSPTAGQNIISYKTHPTQHSSYTVKSELDREPGPPARRMDVSVSLSLDSLHQLQQGHSGQQPLKCFAGDLARPETISALDTSSSNGFAPLSKVDPAATFAARAPVAAQSVATLYRLRPGSPGRRETLGTVTRPLECVRAPHNSQSQFGNPTESMQLQPNGLGPGRRDCFVYRTQLVDTRAWANVCAELSANASGATFVKREPDGFAFVEDDLDSTTARFEIVQELRRGALASAQHALSSQGARGEAILAVTYHVCIVLNSSGGAQSISHLNAPSLYGGSSRPGSSHSVNGHSNGNGLDNSYPPSPLSLPDASGTPYANYSALPMRHAAFTTAAAAAASNGLNASFAPSPSFSAHTPPSTSVSIASSPYSYPVGSYTQTATASPPSHTTAWAWSSNGSSSGGLNPGSLFSCGSSVSSGGSRTPSPPGAGASFGAQAHPFVSAAAYDLGVGFPNVTTTTSGDLSLDATLPELQFSGNVNATTAVAFDAATAAVAGGYANGQELGVGLGLGLGFGSGVDAGSLGFI